MQGIYTIIGLIMGALIFYIGFRIGREGEIKTPNLLPAGQAGKKLFKPNEKKGRIIVRTEAEEAEIEERLKQRPEGDTFERSKRA